MCILTLFLSDISCAVYLDLFETTTGSSRQNKFEAILLLGVPKMGQQSSRDNLQHQCIWAGAASKCMEVSSAEVLQR